ncbi:hypothetical protein [Streptomyces sp. NRRL F-4474]|uniref:hypothetical protein n=1 Tax=Streptomyces sp. NRRL F-4474 TaxID=1463851 RepID=UPI0004CBC97F|nr:hypothetical protein [Streptomyces sp. NRRL F-4474]
MDERGLAAIADKRYRRLLRLNAPPGFGDLDLDEIPPPTVQTWQIASRRLGLIADATVRIGTTLDLGGGSREGTHQARARSRVRAPNRPSG